MSSQVASAFISNTNTPKDSVTDVVAPVVSSNVPSSPTPINASLPSIIQARDQRAYEHQRQKTKHTEDHLLNKARKEGWLPRLYRLRNISGSPAGDVRVTDDDLVHVDNVITRANYDEWRRSSQTDVPRIEVKLADLIATAKPRKTKAGDFEVIPQIRPVIALDDNVNHDISMDETWEYIPRDEELTNKAQELSYARVLSLTT
ncbi:hypothetical protein DL96DRAFT_1576596 [Flagelloscypha sp. PMI_526]|nr:hypothetical protein DL96DRAFT_1576596 [Flagelloscypha sp. PMI_526]